VLGTDALGEVFEWSSEQLKKEIRRLVQLNVNPIEIQVVDMSVLLQSEKK
jgi:hypothetical protein